MASRRNHSSNPKERQHQQEHLASDIDVGEKLALANGNDRDVDLSTSSSESDSSDVQTESEHSDGPKRSSMTISPNLQRDTYSSSLEMRQLVAAAWLYEDLRHLGDWYVLIGFIVGEDTWGQDGFHAVYRLLNQLCREETELNESVNAQDGLHAEVQRTMRNAMTSDAVFKQDCADALVRRTVEALKVTNLRKAENLKSLTRV